MYRFIGLTLLIFGLIILLQMGEYDSNKSENATIILGFLIICAYIIGQFFVKLKLPQITGYIFTGIIFGPHVLNLISKETLINLDFINHMALALIAFYAGGELKLNHLKENRKSLFIIISFQFVIALGVIIVLYLLRSQFSFFNGRTVSQIIGISTILGVVCIARSPSTVIAIINETRSNGRVTDVVLGVTIALDVLVIILFATVISFCKALFIPSTSLNFNFLFILIIEIVISLAVGLVLAYALLVYIKRVNAILPIIALAIGFLVTKFSYFLTDYLEHSHGIGLKMEPLLICITAGFCIQNFSQHGKRFMISLDKVSLLIFTLFFSITGASLNLPVLKFTWSIALIIFFIRLCMIAISTTTGAILANDPKPHRHLYWLGFVAQAGVSLSFAHEISRRFADFGNELACIIIAVVTIDQLIGPITFKFALEKANETRDVISYKDLIKLQMNNPTEGS